MGYIVTPAKNKETGSGWGKEGKKLKNETKIISNKNNNNTSVFINVNKVPQEFLRSMPDMLTGNFKKPLVVSHVIWWALNG